MREYPKRLYHAAKSEDGEPRITSRVVQSAAERKALGAGWEETPAKFLASEPLPRSSGLPRPPVDADLDTLAQAMGSLPSHQAKVVISQLGSINQIDAARTQEHARPSGTRQQVVEALARREADLRGHAAAP